ncbi:MAG: hypothetical protein QX191_01905 [Methylococcaceae bacterium]
MNRIFIGFVFLIFISSCSVRSNRALDTNKTENREQKNETISKSSRIVKCEATIKIVMLQSDEIEDGLYQGKFVGQVQIIKKDKITKKIKLCFTGDKCYRSDIIKVDNCHISKTPYYVGETENWFIPEP